MFHVSNIIMNFGHLNKVEAILLTPLCPALHSKLALNY